MNLPDAPSHWYGSEAPAWQSGYVQGYQDGRESVFDVEKLARAMCVAALNGDIDLDEHWKAYKKVYLIDAKALIEELNK